MDYIDEYPEVLGLDDEDMDPIPRHERRGRGPAGPQDVTFTVFVDKPLPAGQEVCIKGTVVELADPVPMRRCDSGDPRLWTVTVQLNPPAGAAAHGGGFLGSVGAGLFGPNPLVAGLGGRGGDVGRALGNIPTLFEVTYLVRNDSGKIVTEDQNNADGAIKGNLRQFYFHRSRFPGVYDSPLRTHILATSTMKFTCCKQVQ